MLTDEKKIYATEKNNRQLARKGSREPLVRGLLFTSTVTLVARERVCVGVRVCVCGWMCLRAHDVKSGKMLRYMAASSLEKGCAHDPRRSSALDARFPAHFRAQSYPPPTESEPS